MRRPLFIHPEALRDLYLVPRGIAGELTQLIRALEQDATPEGSQPAPGRPGRYELKALGYVVVYEVSDERITILVVEATLQI